MVVKALHMTVSSVSHSDTRSNHHDEYILSPTDLLQLQLGPKVYIHL